MLPAAFTLPTFFNCVFENLEQLKYSLPAVFQPTGLTTAELKQFWEKNCTKNWEELRITGDQLGGREDVFKKMYAKFYAQSWRSNQNCIFLFSSSKDKCRLWAISLNRPEKGEKSYKTKHNKTCCCVRAKTLTKLTPIGYKICASDGNLEKQYKKHAEHTWVSNSLAMTCLHWVNEITTLTTSEHELLANHIPPSPNDP